MNGGGGGGGCVRIFYQLSPEVAKLPHPVLHSKLYVPYTLEKRAASAKAMIYISNAEMRSLRINAAR
jgi:hypothetical protein